ncbi:MFS transporter [Streptomyces sp. NPDC051561]|uniref:MFS transporter n=1 Tax=Streptomyces sp. NPDC051561 TaxID=3365658 RepID=UPI0037B94459
MAAPPHDPQQATGTPSQTRPPVPPGRSALRDVNVLRWLAAYTLSTVGDSIYFLALSWAALDIGGSDRVGLVLAVGAVPRVALMLGGGVVADRIGPRKVVIASDAVRFLVLLSLAAALALASPGLWFLIAAALVFGVVDSLFLPAIGALPPRLTAPDQLARVQGLRALALRLGATAGGPLAGLAMALNGTALAFGTAAALFGLSLLLLITLRLKPPHPPATPAGTDAPARTSFWEDLRGGLSYLRRHPVLARLVTVISLGQLSGIASLNIGLVLLANGRGWGAAGAGWLLGAYSIGSGASALLIILRGTLPRAGLVQAYCLILGAGGLACLPLTPSLLTTAALTSLCGLAAGIHGGLAQALVQTLGDPAYLGRITSVMTLTTLGLAPLTYPLFNHVATTWNLTTAFLSFGVLGIIGAAFALTSRAVRQAELR